MGRPKKDDRRNYVFQVLLNELELQKIKLATQILYGAAFGTSVKKFGRGTWVRAFAIKFAEEVIAINESLDYSQEEKDKKIFAIWDNLIQE